MIKPNNKVVRETAQCRTLQASVGMLNVKDHDSKIKKEKTTYSKDCLKIARWLYEHTSTVSAEKWHLQQQNKSFKTPLTAISNCVTKYIVVKEDALWNCYCTHMWNSFTHLAFGSSWEPACSTCPTLSTKSDSERKWPPMLQLWNAAAIQTGPCLLFQPQLLFLAEKKTFFHW